MTAVGQHTEARQNPTSLYKKKINKFCSTKDREAVKNRIIKRCVECAKHKMFLNHSFLWKLHGNFEIVGQGNLRPNVQRNYGEGKLTSRAYLVRIKKLFPNLVQFNLVVRVKGKLRSCLSGSNSSYWK